MEQIEQQNGYPDPAWYKEFRAAYASSQVFLLHMNTEDYVVPGVFLGNYLARKLADRDVVVFYDIARGITFPLDSYEAKAKKLLGLEAASDPNDMLANLREANNQTEWNLPPSVALPLLESLLRTPAKVTVVIEFAELILPATDYALMSPDDKRVLATLARWGKDRLIKKLGNIAFMIVGQITDLHPRLRSSGACYKAIEIPLPDLDARLRFINYYLKAWEIKPDMSPLQLAYATAGLSLVAIENIFIQGDVRGGLSRELVRQAKAEIVNMEFAGFLDMLEPSYGFEQVGGMEPEKEWARREIIDPVKAGETDDIPQGVILVGPPGTGKTFFVTALAKEVGFNAVALNLERILGGIVGESERNLAKALAAIRSLAPVLVFMDEIDQSDVASRGQSSGNPVAKNLFSMVLRFLGDPANRGKVIFFAASNRPDLLDPALMRFGRVDAIIPVMLPSAEARLGIIKAQAKRQGVEIGPQVAQMIADKTERYSGADVAAVLTKARKVAKREQRAGRQSSGIIGADAMRALDTIKPATLKNAQYYELLAVDACNDTELLPASFSRVLNDRQLLDKEIEEAAPIRRKREL